MDKYNVIERLTEICELLRSDEVRLEGASISHSPEYEEMRVGSKVVSYKQTGDSITIDVDVSYIDLTD